MTYIERLLANLTNFPCDYENEQPLTSDQIKKMIEEERLDEAE